MTQCIERLDPLKGHELYVYVGEYQTVGNSTSIVYSDTPTLINTSRTFEASVDLITDKLPCLSDLGAPSQVVNEVDSISYQITGASIVHKPDVCRWLEWRDSGKPKPVRWGAKGTGGWQYSGDLLLTEYQITGETKQSVTASVTLVPQSSVQYSNVAISNASQIVT